MIIQCKSCNEDLSRLDSSTPCPKCGDSNRNYFIEFEDNIEVHDSTKVKHKNPQSTHKRKIQYEASIGADYSTKLNRYVEKTREIDRENDHYLEKVVDPKTGETIHFNSEPLSQHRNHGSAKKQ